MTPNPVKSAEERVKAKFQCASCARCQTCGMFHVWNGEPDYQDFGLLGVAVTAELAWESAARCIAEKGETDGKQW